MDLRAGMAAPHQIHDVLAAHTRVAAGQLVVDLGCGYGATLAAVAAYAPEATLVGLDLDTGALAGAAGRLAGGGAHLVRADLSGPLPLPDSTVHAVVCHNVVELLADPVALFTEIGRVLDPGGWAVVSHTDFAGLIIHGADTALTARVQHAYAHLPQPWMAHIDPYAARKLPGLARRAGLEVTHFCGHVVAADQLTGQPRRRVDEITAVVRGHARRGQVDLSEHDLDRWYEQLVTAEHAGGFAFAETALITVASALPVSRVSRLYGGGQGGGGRPTAGSGTAW